MMCVSGITIVPHTPIEISNALNILQNRDAFATLARIKVIFKKNFKI
jgi:hypothetical protein